MTLATKCSHEESRLSCIECSKPLCSNCLVQCPVGFRCKSCVGTVKDPFAVTPMIVAKTLGMFVALGSVGGWVMPFIQVPFVSCFICFFLGLFSGRYLAQFIDHKLGHRTGKVVVFGLLIGMALSPIGLLPPILLQMFFMALTGHGGTIFEALIAVVNALWCPVAFLVGVLRPTVWGETF